MTVTERRFSSSVLVIGTGGAGLRAAIELAESGVDVLAVGKRPVEDTHTALAAGGINAALATMDPEDSWQQHAADTLKESYLLADPRTVEIVTQGAARGIDDLERYGMAFAREEDGRISQRFFGAHKFRRTAFAGDYTGLEIQRTLIRRAAQLDIPVLDGVYITRLLVDDGAVFGAYGFDLTHGTRCLIHADAVILAAGGHTRIWRRTSSRRDENTGDSFRLAVEAGARIRDPELVQFHPSGIIGPEETREPWSARPHAERAASCGTRRESGSWPATTPADGAVHPRPRGPRRLHGDQGPGAGPPTAPCGSTSPTAAADDQDPAAAGLPDPSRPADAGHHPGSDRDRAHRALLDGRGVGPARDHSTDVRGLYAIGEASSGLHGANRLGGNSLPSSSSFYPRPCRSGARSTAPLAIFPARSSRDAPQLRCCPLQTDPVTLPTTTSATGSPRIS